MSGQLSRLTERLAQSLARPVAAADLARARLHLLDWLGCALAGAREPDVVRVRTLATAEGAGPCRIIGGGWGGPQTAALANGPAGAILEMDDVDRRGLLHPGPVILPAALAMAQHLGEVDGVRLLEAVVRGYEAMIRIGRAAGASHYRFFHPTATCGGFGAAAAGASLLRLNADRTAHALGLAGQQAFGLWRARHEPGSVKALHDGRAAANGLASALLAADGFRGPLGVLEGEQGFFPALAPEADPEAVMAPAEAWLIHEVSFKPHAACRHAHPVIDAALALRERLTSAVQRVQVATYADAVRFCDKPHPRTSAEARFSIQHSVAAVLVHGDAGLNRFEPEALPEAETAAMRACVSVGEDAAFTNDYPARFGARVVVTAGGVTHEAEVRDALGDPENPMSPEALRAKARALMAWGGMGAAGIDRLIAAAEALGEGASVPDLAAALAGAAA